MERMPGRSSRRKHGGDVAPELNPQPRPSRVDIRMKEEREVVMLQTCEVERVIGWVERRHESGQD
jgi:hypothetical protein